MFNTNSIFQLYHCENKLIFNEIMTRFAKEISRFAHPRKVMSPPPLPRVHRFIYYILYILTKSALGDPRLGTNFGGENNGLFCRGLCFCWKADKGIVSSGSLLWKKKIHNWHKHARKIMTLFYYTLLKVISLTYTHGLYPKD